MAVPKLPPPVDIDQDTKKAIIDGLKQVLAAFQKSGAINASVTYQDVISNPEMLERFVSTFTGHRAECDAIVRAKDGGGAVRDDDQMLICNVSLNQIQQLLVRTCAKKVFETTKPQETVTVTETVTTKGFMGMFKKSEQVEVQKTGDDPIDERKTRELLRYIAFGWQLPLLQHYRTHLTYQQIIEIGEDVVALQNPAAIATVGQFDPVVLKKAKQATGAEFADVLVNRPQAIAGIAVWSRDMYELYRKMLGDKAWVFFSRDKDFFNVVAGLDKATARIFGDVLCYVAAENLAEIQRLNIDKVEVLVSALKGALAEKAPLVLSRPAFAKEMLRKVVDNLLHMNQEKDKLMVSFGLTCKAMLPGILDWLGKQPKA